MVKLIRKGEEAKSKVVLWMTEVVDKRNIKRKQFTIYDTSFEEIEALLLKDFKIK